MLSARNISVRVSEYFPVSATSLPYPHRATHAAICPHVDDVFVTGFANLAARKKIRECRIAQPERTLGEHSLLGQHVSTHRAFLPKLCTPDYRECLSCHAAITPELAAPFLTSTRKDS
jgi:hypothetical protein